jgi:hypothetical protein
VLGWPAAAAWMHGCGSSRHHGITATATAAMDAESHVDGGGRYDCTWWPRF